MAAAAVGSFQHVLTPVPQALDNRLIPKNKWNSPLIAARLLEKFSAPSSLGASSLLGRAQPCKLNAGRATFSIPLQAKPHVSLQFLSSAQIESDANLVLIWSRMADALILAGIHISKNDMPKNANQIRSWLSAHHRELAFIEKLDLTHLALTVIPQEFSDLPLPQLLRLGLDSNKLTQLPRGFGRLWPKLRVFSISYNQIKVLEAELGNQWKGLRMLYLQKNQLTALPGGFGKDWSDLDTFYLYGNQIQGFVCDVSAHWKKLDEFILFGNKIKNLPASFGSHWKWWREKREIILDDNPILLTMEWRVEKLIEKANECEQVRKLCKRADAQGFTVRFETPPSGFEAETDFSRRLIVLNPNLSEDQTLSLYIFELTNAVKQKKFNKLTKIARARKISEEEFVRRYELHEHFGVLRHRKITSSAIERLNWNPSVNRYQKWEEDFEKAWIWIQKTSHAEYYRKIWAQLSRAATA